MQTNKHTEADATILNPKDYTHALYEKRK